MMTLRNIWSAQNARHCIISKIASRNAVGGKFQLGVILLPGQDTHIGTDEVSQLFTIYLGMNYTIVSEGFFLQVGWERGSDGFSGM